MPAARGGVFGTSPWLRAPVLLLRQPSVFLAIVGACAVLSIAAASGVLFVSTLGTASLQAQAADDCREASLPTAVADVDTPQLARARAGGQRQVQAAGLPRPYVSEIGEARIQDSQVHIFSLAGSLDHVEKLTPSAGVGAWIPNTFADKLRLRPGDTIRTTSGQPLRIGGIYRDLAPSPFQVAHLPPFFCSWQAQFVPTAAADTVIAATPPRYRQAPMIFVDEATEARVADGTVTVSWYAPLSPKSTSLHRYHQGLDQMAAAASAISDTYALDATVDKKLPTKLDIAERAQSGVSGSVIPIDIAGVVVALLLVAGAGGFWATHRSREVRLLVARGVGTAALGSKAVLETLPPALLGLAGGYFAALALVRKVGPSQVLEPGGPIEGMVLALLVLAAGLLLIGLVGGVSGRDRVLGAPTGWLRVVPWELALLGIAVWMGLLIRAGGGITIDHTIVKVSPLAFVFPLIGATAVLLLVGRIVAWLLPRADALARKRGIAGYFALRRIIGSRAVVVGLIIGTALPCCLLTYGSTVTKGIADEVTTKYETNLGAEHALLVFGVRNSVPDPHGRGTFVAIFEAEPRLADGEPAYVLGVDPKTFNEFAFVDAAQRSQVAKLHTGTGGQIPAIIVNAPKNANASAVSIRSTTLPLDVVARDAVFPGLRNGYRPMVVVNVRALTHVDPDADRQNQFWTDDENLTSGYALLTRENFSVLTEITSDVVIGTTGLLPVTWVFGYLRALAVLIGVVAVAGLVFALASRTRRRTVSYVLSRRMGMSKGTHVRSLVLELALVVGFGWLAGSGMGAASFGTIYRALDVYPALPPPMSFVLPAATLALTAVVTAAVVLLASIATHALAERAKPADILRLE
jgi:putative ABC transport system permease protein